MRVLWCVRRNLTDNPGGDTTQILNTAAAVRAAGVDVEMSDAVAPSFDGFDVVHLFHLDRLWEIHHHARRLVAAKKPYVLSTIWWPATEFDAAAREGVQGALARMFGSENYASFRVIQRALLHAAQAKSLRFIHPRIMRFHAAARFVLQQAAAILPNGVAEQREVERAFGVERPCVVVPNAADASLFEPPADEANRAGVLCVGRIEPRKNQLNLIRALRDTDIPLTLVGPVGRFNRRYAQRCRELATPNIEFLDARPPEELRTLYQQAQVHACVSYYETPGLASMEAALCGCELVVTPGGCTREYFDGHAEFADPRDPATIRTAIEHAMQTDKAAALAQRIRKEFSWKAAAAATIRGYELALAQK